MPAQTEIWEMTRSASVSDPGVAVAVDILPIADPWMGTEHEEGSRTRPGGGTVDPARLADVDRC
jgi:hypothetical protein